MKASGKKSWVVGRSFFFFFQKNNLLLKLPDLLVGNLAVIYKTVEHDAQLTYCSRQLMYEIFKFHSRRCLWVDIQPVAVEHVYTYVYSSNGNSAILYCYTKHDRIMKFFRVSKEKICWRLDNSWRMAGRNVRSLGICKVVTNRESNCECFIAIA